MRKVVMLLFVMMMFLMVGDPGVCAVGRCRGEPDQLGGNHLWFCHRHCSRAWRRKARDVPLHRHAKRLDAIQPLAPAFRSH